MLLESFVCKSTFGYRTLEYIFINRLFESFTDLWTRTTSILVIDFIEKINRTVDRCMLWSVVILFCFGFCQINLEIRTTVIGAPKILFNLQCVTGRGTRRTTHNQMITNDRILLSYRSYSGQSELLLLWNRFSLSHLGENGSDCEEPHCIPLGGGNPCVNVFVNGCRLSNGKTRANLICQTREPHYLIIVFSSANYFIQCSRMLAQWESFTESATVYFYLID